MKKFGKNMGVMLAVVSAACIFTSGSALAADNSVSTQIANSIMASSEDFSTQITESIMASSGTTSVETDTYTDDAGNTFSAGQDVPITKDVKNEAFAGGYTVSLTNAEVANGVYLAGYDVELENATVGGSAYLAGYSLDVNSVINNNIFAAANILKFGSKTSGKTLYAAGNILDISGTYDIVDVSGGSVTLDAEVNGDASIEADKIVIGSNTKIDGKLTVRSSVEPEISSDAVIGDYKFIKTVTPDYEEAIDVSRKASVGNKILNGVKSVIYWMIASTILAFIFCAIFGKALDDAKEMIVKKPVAMLLSGFIALVAFPVAMIITCITYVGLPLAGFTTLLSLPIMFFSTVFAASSFGRLIFDKIKPGFNPVAASLLGTIIIIVVKKIPFIGGLVGFACILFTVGYFIQLAFGQLKTFHLKREVITNVQDHTV